MRSLLLWLLAIAAVPGAFTAEETRRSRDGGPVIGELRRLPEITPFDVLARMFMTIEERWFVPQYEAAQSVDLRLRVDANLPAGTVDRRLEGAGGGENLEFDVTIEGVAAPNGKRRLNVRGELGEMEMVNDLRRRIMISEAFKSFSDTPVRTRSANANLTNYRSYLLKNLNAMKRRIMDSGQYRSVYVGTGIHRGREVHVLRVYKPSLEKRPKKRQPIPLRKLWTFWQDGGYEIWVDRASELPVTVFYTNTTDNIYANLTIDYDSEMMPMRINFQNNSLKSEGNGDVIFHYDRDRMLRGLSLKFDGVRGVSLRLDATLAFGGEPDESLFRVLPPFGFQKINRDHLRLMVMTQISGSLLKLKKHGINFKNFKF